MRKTSMVCFEKSADIVPRTLVGFVNGYTVTHYFQRIQHICDAIEQVLSFSFHFNIGIKFLFIFAWNYIPCFSTSFVVVIDWIKPEILDMPAEGGKHHAHVNPRTNDATDELFLLVSNFQNWKVWFINVIQIEHVGKVVEIIVLGPDTLAKGEPTTMFLHWQVCGVFDRRFKFPLEANFIIFLFTIFTIN